MGRNNESRTLSHNVESPPWNALLRIFINIRRFSHTLCLHSMSWPGATTGETSFCLQYLTRISHAHFSEFRFLGDCFTGGPGSATEVSIHAGAVLLLGSV